MIPKTGHAPNLQAWMDWIHGAHDRAGLAAQLHDDVVFTSPVVHTPQRGKEITLAYLGAAGQTLGGDTFEYTRVFDCGDRAVLEFACLVGGKQVNGVDMIEWDENGLITEFKVMVRPLQGMQAVHAAMGAMLEKMKQEANA